MANQPSSVLELTELYTCLQWFVTLSQDWSIMQLTQVMEHGRITHVSNRKVPVLLSSLRCYICHWDCLFKHMICLTCLIHFEELNFIKWSVFYKLIHFILLDMLKAKYCFKVYQWILSYRIAKKMRSQTEK